ncbi:cytochrome-c peroxidase [Crenothrix sp.]|uniref:cytochrome-c peroxidase n=1 Tax=Crenothrix sp. TaxID=3100433 RepID=UPI00374D9AA6
MGSKRNSQWMASLDTGANRELKKRQATIIMKLKTRVLLAASVAAMPLLLWSGGAAALTPLELLGKNVFFDKISTPEDQQSCASCHDPAKGWILPDSAINKTTVVAPGAKPKRLGSIKPPSNAYASFSPPFRPLVGVPFIPPWEGGNFWDGRAEGCGKENGPNCQIGISGTFSATITLADLGTHTEYAKFLGPTADQALNPFPNLVEQNIRVRRVCQIVKDAKYGYLYQQAFGERLDCKAQPANNPPFLTSYKRIAVALAAWQSSVDVNSFSSKRDVALNNDADGKFPLDGLTAKENLGHDLFYSTFGPLVGNATKRAHCVVCHNGVPQDQAADPRGETPKQLYTDNRYHHIGVPYNREIPEDGTRNAAPLAKGAKQGLKGHVNGVEAGEFRTPTLRNVAKAPNGFVKAYTHNGWFKSLESLVHFYNTRDVLVKCEALGITNATEKQALQNNCWPTAEFTNQAGVVVGNLGLTNGEEAALVAYLKTLTDTHTPTKPR